MLRSLLILLFAFPAMAAPPVLTISPISPKPGDPVIVSAGVPTTFDVRGSAEVTRHGARAVVFTMPATGGVIVVATSGKVAAPEDVGVIVVGAGQPGPNPPAPADELTKLATDLQAAVANDPPAQKLLIPALAKVYRESPTAIDAAKNWGELETEIGKRMKTAGVAGTLVNLQTAAAKYLLAQIPGMDPNASEVVMDDNGRALAKRLFGTLADALGQVK